MPNFPIPATRQPYSAELVPIDHKNGRMGRIAGPGRGPDELAAYIYRRDRGFFVTYWRIVDVHLDPVRLRDR